MVPGTDVQAYDADLEGIAALTPADSSILVGDGSGWVAESGATVRTSLGLGTAAIAAADDFVGVGGDTMTGALVVSNVTNATSKDTGAIVTDGGVGVEGSVIAGQRIVAGQMTLTAGTYGSQTLAGANSILLNTAGGDIIINGFADGIAGQQVTLIKISSSNAVTLNHDNGGTQPVMLRAGTGSFGLTDGSFGGITLMSDGTRWYDTTQPVTYAP